MNRSSVGNAALGIASAWLVCGAPARAIAQSLPEAVIRAMKANPALAAQEAAVKAAEAQLTITRAEGRPSLSVQAGATYNFQPPALAFENPQKNVNSDVVLSLPLYQGGSVKHGIRAARLNLQGSEDQVASATSDLIANVGSAYVGLMAARENLEILTQYVSQIQGGLIATKRRYEAGELTKTDIAQSETSLYNAQVNLEGARSSLQAALQQYVYYVGSDPEVLSQPPELMGVPSTPGAAWSLAVANNKDLAAAEKSAEAARENTSVAEASRLPRIRAIAVGSYLNYLNSSLNPFFGDVGPQVFKTAQVGVQLSLPLFQGGALRGAIENARALQAQTRDQARDSSNGLKREVNADFAQLASLKNELVISNAQVKFAGEAVYGVKRLNALGSRTVQDVLNAEQALLTAKSQRVQIKAQVYVAELTLLSKTGTLALTSFGSKPDIQLNVSLPD